VRVRASTLDETSQRRKHDARATCAGDVALAPFVNVADDVGGVGDAARARLAGFPSAASHAAWPRPVQRVRQLAETSRKVGGGRRSAAASLPVGDTSPTRAPSLRRVGEEGSRQAARSCRAAEEAASPERGKPRSPEWGRSPTTPGRGKKTRLPPVDRAGDAEEARLLLRAPRVARVPSPKRREVQRVQVLPEGEIADAAARRRPRSTSTGGSRPSVNPRLPRVGVIRLGESRQPHAEPLERGCRRAGDALLH
jgi:hypothetical protein